MRVELFVASSMISLAVPGAAMAQQESQAASSPQVPTGGAAPAEAGPATPTEDQSPAQTSGIQDIIVTAQRREESVQKASVSIAVLSAAAIANAGVTQARDLATVVPGVQIGQGGAATQIYIRGVGDFGSTSSTNPAVAFNVDGVYVARPAGIEGNFYDIERVEVLKGPQGTLYGRNATGGAINVITNKPKLGVREMAGAIEVGNYHKVLAEAAVNLPLGENAALRFATQLVHRGPYVTENFDDDIHQSVRGQFLWKPSDALSVRVGADYINIEGGGPGYVPLQRIPGVDRWTSDTNPAVTDFYNSRAFPSGVCAPSGTFPGLTFRGGCPALPIGPGGALVPFVSLVEPPRGERGNLHDKFYSFFGQLDYDFGPVTLTILPAYRSVSLDYIAYPGLLRFDISAGNKPERSKATSLEARLSHESASLKAVLGLYYFDEEQRGLASVRAGFVQSAAINQAIDTRNYAAFGQANVSLTDTLRLIGGARYTSDRRQSGIQTYVLSDSLQFLQALGGGCVPGTVPGASLVGCRTNNLRGDKTFKKFNWRAGAEFDIAPRSMVYATASTGFKAGGFYGGTAPNGIGLGSYQPEQLMAYEVGSRNRFLDNKLQVNLEGFYYDYKDHQEAVIITDGGGQTAQAILNAGKGRVYGGNVDVVFQPTRNDNFHAGVEYLNSKYTEFLYQSPILFRPAAAGGPQRFIFGNGQGTGCQLTETTPLPAVPNAQGIVGYQTVNCAGFPLTRSPKWSGVASYMHNFELADGSGFEAQGDMQFQSKRYIATDYLPISLVGSYAKFNASLTYRAENNAWSLSGFVRNITNRAVFTGAYKANFVTGFSVSSIEAPRTYGARLNFKF